MSRDLSPSPRGRRRLRRAPDLRLIALNNLLRARNESTGNISAASRTRSDASRAEARPLSLREIRESITSAPRASSLRLNSGGDDQENSSDDQQNSRDDLDDLETFMRPYVAEINTRLQEEADMDDPFTDQILRPPQNTVQPRRNRQRSSSIITNPYEDDPPHEPLAPVDSRPRGRGLKHTKYSPTPSIKKGKAEKLIKEHGSPPGIRVTAGGRVVPDGMIPIESPMNDQVADLNRGYSKRTYPAPSANMAPNGPPLNGFVLEMGNGSLGQIVDGTVRPLQIINGVLQLHIPAPNLPMNAEMVSAPYSSQWPLNLPPPALPMPTVSNSSHPMNLAAEKPEPVPTIRELQAMEQTHMQLEQDLKTLDRNEVIYRASITPIQRAEIVRRRVIMINRIDESRKVVVAAKTRFEQNQKREAEASTLQQSQAGQVAPVSNIALPPNNESTANLQYFAASQPFQMEQYGAGGYLPTNQYLPTMNGFEPNVPEFIPSHASGYGPQFHHAPSALQQRSGNVGLGVQHGTDRSQTSAKNAKSTNVTRATASINLDGSAQQPRRSHAITIKDPNEMTNKLNPASPTYQPANNSKNQVIDNDTSYSTSDALAAQIGSVNLQDPDHGDHQQERKSSNGTSHGSDSSATTADFFPRDSYKYSAKKAALGSRCDQVNLATWLDKSAKANQSKEAVASNCFSDQYIYDKESSFHEMDVDLPDVDEANGRVNNDELTSTGDHVGKLGDSPSLPTLRRSTSAIQSSNSAPLRKQPSISRLLQKASERAASFSDSSYHKTESYWEGYRVGIHQNILGDGTDRDHRIGYRDGLLRSCKMSEDVSTPRRNSQNPQQSPEESEEGKDMGIENAGGADQTFTASKSSSFPLFRDNAAHPVPNAPANSLATTPTHSKPTKKQISPALETTLDSPTARADFMSQPNINLSSSRERVIGTQTSQSLLEVSQPLSPLAKRSPARSSDSNMGEACLPFATRMKARRDEAQKHPFTKSKSSVAQTNEIAQGRIRQYDGSADDDEPLVSAESRGDSTAKPAQTEKAKPKGTSSPVKAKASAAVATMKQVAGIGPKKDEAKSAKEKPTKRESDPALMSSPEKKKWRQNWAKTFGQVKVEEQEEIEKYKHDNPIPQ